MTAYLGRPGANRSSVISFLRGHVAGAKAGPLHRAIARAGFRAIVTAWYDDLLEQALAKEGYRVRQVVRDRPLVYSQESEREAVVVKLYGFFSHDESLILDARDHDELLFQLDRKLELVTGFCQLRPPLFIGFDLADPTPRLLYTRALINAVENQPACVVWPGALDAVRPGWTGRNVYFISAEAAPFLQALSSQLPSVAAGGKGPIRVNRAPYKFLDYYESQDADIFCGRDTESQIVARMALSHRLLTLFGPSGAGKTSLLLAGALPRLASEGYQHVYVPLDDPLQAVRRAVAARAGQSPSPVTTGEGGGEGQTLRAFLNAILKAAPAAEDGGLSKKSAPAEANDLAQLRQNLEDHFDREELRTLCFDLQVCDFTHKNVI